MTVVLELKPETEEALQKKAKSKGFEVNVYLENLIEKDIHEGKRLMKFSHLFAKNLKKAE